jgi:trigger factor
MHVSRTSPKDTEAVLTITANEADLSPIKQRVLKRLAKDMKLAGFRKGNVPLNLVEKNLDPQAFQSEFLDEALNRLYGTVLEQESLRPVDNPKVELKKFVPFSTLEFTAAVSVIGKIKIGDYKKIRLPRPKVTITDKEVAAVIESLRQRMAERSPVTRAAKKKDEAVIDFKGTDSKGAAVNGAEGQDYPLVLGSDSFIPGFEANLIGMKPGETKSFTVTFPKDYGVQALQNKKVTFEVTIKSLNEMVEPKVDDDFAKKAGPFKTLTELKADIKKQLAIEREQQARNAYEEELLQKLAAKSTVGVPLPLVEMQIERIENEERQNLTYRGQTWEEHLREEGVTAEEHKEQKRPTAENRVKIGILLSEIAEIEKVQVLPEEFKARMEVMKAQYKDEATQAELDKPEVQRDILARMMTEKTIDKLTAYATAK